MLNKDKKNNIIKAIDETYDNTGTFLNYSTPYELLIAVILSAQCTDERVNKVTTKLFNTANTPEQILIMGHEKLGNLIKSCGLFRTKSKNIVALSKIICERFDGKVPHELNELMSLPGVGRKTANVILSNAFKKDAIAVDTHVFRVSNRTGLAAGKNVRCVEDALMKIIDKSMWSRMHYKLILHGRNVCTARNPKCNICILNNYCIYYNKYNNGE